MYRYHYDDDSGGYILESAIAEFSNEPRPVYPSELDLFGFNKYWTYGHEDKPYLWCESSKYIYKGKIVARLKGGSSYVAPTIEMTEEGAHIGELKPVDLDLMVKKTIQ